MPNREHAFEVAMSEFDWKFISIATEQGLVSDVDMLRVLMHETSLPKDAQNRPTIPQLLLENQVLTYNQIDAVLKQMFGRDDDAQAAGPSSAESAPAACMGVKEPCS